MKDNIHLVKIQDSEKEDFRSNEFAEYWDVLKSFGVEGDCFKNFDVFFGCNIGDAYWFVRNSQKIGFVMKHHLPKSGLCIDQFCMLEQYREKGLGTECVRTLLAEYPGVVTLSYLNENIRAKNFWHKIVDTFNDNVDESGRKVYGTMFKDHSTLLQFTSHVQSQDTDPCE